MPSITVELELCGTRWLGQVAGPRGGREIKADDLDQALADIKAAALTFGAPMPPSPEPEPVAPLKVEPRKTRRVNAANDAGASA